jgi:quercetin dioxygenase-like cupin family protein
MKRSAVLLSAVAAIVLFTLGAAYGQKAASKKVVYVSADKADFKEMPGGSGGVSRATVWGDPEKGAHGTLSKFKSGYEAGEHTHTNDITIVVIKGAYLYKDADGEKRVGPGDFLKVPGGHKHSSGGDKSEGALFYESSSAKFDLIPAK